MQKGSFKLVPCAAISAPRYDEGPSNAKIWLRRNGANIWAGTSESKKMLDLCDDAVEQPDGSYRFPDSSLVIYRQGQAGTSLVATGIPRAIAANLGSDHEPI